MVMFHGRSSKIAIAVAIVLALAMPAFARGGGGSSSSSGGSRGGSTSTSTSSRGSGSWGGSRSSGSGSGRSSSTVSSGRWSGRTATGYRTTTTSPAVRVWYKPIVTATKPTVGKVWGHTTTTATTPSKPLLLRGVETGGKTLVVHERNRFYVLRNGVPTPVPYQGIIYPDDFFYVVDMGNDGCDESTQECDPYDADAISGVAELDDQELAILQARHRAELARAKRLHQ